MSFTVHYEYSKYFKNPRLSLTAVVGKDGQHYWLQRNVEALFFEPIEKSSVRVSDVTELNGVSPVADDPFLKERVIDHIDLMKKFKKTKSPSLRKFGRKLTNKRTLVECLKEEELIQLVKPTVLRILDEKMKKSSQVMEFHKDPKVPIAFFAWLGCFKHRVQKELYCLRMELFFDIQKLDFIFPEIVTFKHGDRQVRYIQQEL